MPKARLKLPQELENLLASDWERVLDEATLAGRERALKTLGKSHFASNNVSNSFSRPAIPGGFFSLLAWR